MWFTKHLKQLKDLSANMEKLRSDGFLSKVDSIFTLSKSRGQYIHEASSAQKTIIRDDVKKKNFCRKRRHLPVYTNQKHLAKGSFLTK